MPYQTRIPPIKVQLSVDEFNYLIEKITGCTNNDVDSIKKVAESLKSKLLKYSIPRKGEDEINYVDVRFYNSEASSIIKLLANNTDSVVSNNYYDILLNTRNNKNNSQE